MSIVGEQILLRTYLLTTDHHMFAPVYERLVHHAGKKGLAGATVIKGIAGFGSRGVVSTSGWSLVSSVPVIVEIVDSPEKIIAFVEQTLHKVMLRGMVTLERAGVMMYRRRGDAGPHPPLSLLESVTPLSTVPKLESRENMQVNENGVLLRIFAGESDLFEKKPLHDAIIRKARELGLSGATVLRGSMGFGANSVLHTAKVLELSTDLPILIELVDSKENIAKLLPHLDQMVQEGMITMEDVRVLMYRHNGADGQTSPPASCT